MHRELDTINYAVGFYTKSLAYGKERKCCTTCQRDMDSGELVAFERFVGRCAFLLGDLAHRLSNVADRSDQECT